MFPFKRHNYYNIGRKCEMKKRDSIYTSIVHMCMYYVVCTYIHMCMYIVHTEGFIQMGEEESGIPLPPKIMRDLIAIHLISVYYPYRIRKVQTQR